jgi:uncharacterized protein
VTDLAARHRALEAHLAALPGVVVAFSGGVDSAFLLKVAVDALGPRAHAVTAVSPTMARAEVADARALGAELGLGDRHHLVTPTSWRSPATPRTRSIAARSARPSS